MTAQGISLKNVSKSYGSVTALEELSLDVAEKEFVTILGPSGSGKTTLLMLVAGFTTPDTGVVSVGQRDVTGLPPHQRGIGVVFQDYALFPHMTVRQNITFPLRMRSISRVEQNSLCAEVISTVRLTGLEDRMPAQLSGGQMQRVALARAMVFNPPLLLMDEPLSALDKNLREHMQIELKDIQERLGVTVLYVTHDQQEALTMSDRIAVLNEGRIEQFGPADAIYDIPANRFVAEFIGETNIFSSRAETLVHGNLQVSMPHGSSTGARFCQSPSQGQQGWLSVRPEKLTILNGNADGHCALSGRLENVIHQGDTIKYLIRSDEVQTDSERGLVIMKAHNRARTHSYRRGDRIKVGWRPDDATFVL